MDTQKDVERLVELVGTGEAATMEYEPEARALMTKLAGQFLADQHRIANALETLAGCVQDNRMDPAAFGVTQA